MAASGLPRRPPGGRRAQSALALASLSLARAAVAAPGFQELAGGLRAAAEGGDLARLEAVEAELLRHYPDFPPTHPVIAKRRMDLRFEHAEVAVEHLKEFRRKHPRIHDVPLLFNLGSLLKELGRHAEAIEAFASAVAVPGAPDPSASASLAACHLDSGSTEGAIAAAEAVARALAVDAAGTQVNQTALRVAPQLALCALRAEAQLEGAAAGDRALPRFGSARRLAAAAAGQCLERVAARRRPAVSTLRASSSRVATLTADPREDSWEKQIEKALRKMSTKRRPLRVKLPSGARPEDVWTKLGWGLEQWRDAGYLRRQAGGERVYASCLERNSDDPFGYSDQRRLKVFGDFLDELQSGSACFLNVQGREGAVYEPPLHKALSADLPVPAPLRRVARGMLDKVTLWMGNATGGPVGSACGADGGAGRPLGGEPPGGPEEGGGTCSGSGAGGSAGGKSISRFHADNQDNLVAMVRGSKRWALFPPRQAHNLYTVGEIASVAASGVVHYVNDAYGKSSSHGTHFSLVPDVFAPTEEILERFPLLREALPDRLEAELQPGELLFLPAGWFHQVHSFGEHVSVNFWWTPA